MCVDLASAGDHISAINVACTMYGHANYGAVGDANLIALHVRMCKWFLGAYS